MSWCHLGQHRQTTGKFAITQCRVDLVLDLTTNCQWKHRAAVGPSAGELTRSERTTTALHLEECHRTRSSRINDATALAGYAPTTTYYLGLPGLVHGLTLERCLAIRGRRGEAANSDTTTSRSRSRQLGRIAGWTDERIRAADAALGRRSSDEFGPSSCRGSAADALRPTTSARYTEILWLDRAGSETRWWPGAVREIARQFASVRLDLWRAVRRGRSGSVTEESVAASATSVWRTVRYEWLPTTCSPGKHLTHLPSNSLQTTRHQTRK